MAALVTVAIVAAGSLAALRYGAIQQQREKEAWLLFVGGEYRQALERYARAGVGAPGQGPRELTDLLEDRRGTKPLHHLRRLYADPMSGRVDWVLLRDGQGYITALHSGSAKTPRRRAGFDKSERGFERAVTYRDWVFRPAADASAFIGQNAPDGDRDDRPLDATRTDTPP